MKSGRTATPRLSVATRCTPLRWRRPLQTRPLRLPPLLPAYSSETAAADDAEAPAAAGSAPAESAGGSLASDAQLAALREKLSGNA